MKAITGEIFINAPVAEVFDFVADERNEPLYNANMRRAEKLTPGPVGVGTRFSAVMKGRSRTELTIEYASFNRPQTLGSISRTAEMDIEGELTFVPEGKGTRLRWVWKPPLWRAASPHDVGAVDGKPPRTRQLVSAEKLSGGHAQDCPS